MKDVRWRSAAIALLAACDERGVVGPPAHDGGAGLHDAAPGPRDAGAGPRDTGSQPDLAEVPDVPPPAFGRGFTDLTGPVERDAPFRIATPAATMINTDDLVAHMGDLDGDGRDEVVITHWMSGEMPRATPYAVYRYDRAARAFARDAATRLPDLPPLAGVLDLDGDGRDDLLALDRDRAIVWGAAGGFGEPAPLDPARLDWGNSFRIGSYFLDDLDDDGWLDLLVASDCCRTPCLDLRVLLRTGPRAFEERPSTLTIEQVSRPYTAFSARFAPGERVLMSVGTSCVDPRGAPVFYRSGALDDAGYPRFAEFDPTPQEVVFREAPGSFPTIAVASPMTACADDIDNDGLLDLGVALDPMHLLLRGTARWPFEDASPRTGVTFAPADSGRPMIPWSMMFIDLDRDTRLDWLVAHGNDQGAWFGPPERFIGPQSVAVYQAVGATQFRDVSASLNVQRRGQWRTLTVEDWDDDGDADLAVGGQHELPRLYRNDIENGNHGVVLRLRGTSSNHLGVGAWLTVWIDEGSAPLRRYVGGVAQTFAVQEPFVSVGLGRATRIARLRVTWPSGTVQELRDLAADRAHAIVEPSAFTVSPESRRASADGASVITVRVTPRDLGGALRADARVELSLAGDGALAGPVAQGPDGWTARVRAPAAPGSAVVTIRVDGVALAVRPRLWWQ